MARSGLLPVFVDTSLDTHLAIAVSPSDTVASVKSHGEKQPSNDSYCDAKNGESRKAETNDASTAACEAVYIEEAPLCLEKEKDIFRKKSRHDFESPEIPEGPAKKKAKNDDEKKKVVRKDGDISKKDGSLLEVTQTIGIVVLTEKKKKHRDGTKTKGPCSDFPSEVKHKPQVEDRYQVRPDTDTDNQPVVCFAGPTEVVNTSLKKKKKCKRNASSEDPTTLRLTPTQSRKEGEEEIQGDQRERRRQPAEPENLIEAIRVTSITPCSITTGMNGQWNMY
ncbi:hypothetical protein FCM35_KLT07246 [Carex littledalei]|uniref:Uncharacterized protein n=1 Tax=Carex littledalei TaxID=544730 RepID=A0A833QYD9_9POAL|nr:hypothetical protein FCM35_KLT07246 [Carex littledalei]